MQKLTKPQRDEIRRKEIIAAARKCVAEKGFHAASVDLIAKSADINVGQLYRYFKNKEAIIAAITDDLFTNNIKRIEKEGYSSVFDTDNKENFLIMNDINAEAARNPQIGKIVSAAKQKMENALIKMRMEQYPQITQAQAKEIVLALAVMSNGLFIRRQQDKTFTKQKAARLADKIVTLFAADCLAKK